MVKQRDKEENIELLMWFFPFFFFFFFKLFYPELGKMCFGNIIKTHNMIQAFLKS